MGATRRIRKYQRGTEDLEPGPLPPEKRRIGFKEAAGIYDPGPGTPQQKEYADAYKEHEALMAELRKSVYGTIGINIDGQEMEVPLWNKDMTPQQAEEAARDRLEMGLHPFTPEDQLVKVQNDEQALPNQTIGFSRGTDSVPAMLTPHEAVLNRNAADLLGRDKIRKLNAMGNRMPQRFASGTDDVKDLLRDADNTFYGGVGGPQPTPKPTPIPRLYAYGTDNVDDTMGSLSFTDTRRNAASRYPRRPGIVNVTPDSPVSGSRYLGPNGTDLGPQYDPFGSVNPLPRGAVGVQGARNAAGFNRSLNGSQPPAGATPSPAMTHTQMAEDIARRNLTAAGSSLGSTQQDVPPGFQPYVSPEDAASRGLQWTGGETGWQPYVSPEQATEQNLQYTGGNPALQLANQMANDRQQTTAPQPTTNVGVIPDASIRPGRYADAAGPISQSGTGYSYINARGAKVDIAGPPRKDGYGSAYGY